MEEFAVGDIILVKFPFSNLKNQKIRPALVVAEADFKDVIVCQITSQKYESTRSVAITRNDFVQGSLPVTSFIRLAKLFTFSRSLIIKKVAVLKQTKRDEVLVELRAIFTQ